MAQIFFNGKSYNSPEEMPTNERQAYDQMMGIFVDKNGNGIPDFLEGDIVKNISTVYNSTNAISFSGNTYSNFNELPPEVREKIKTAFNKMSGMGLGVNQMPPQVNQESIKSEAYVQPTNFVSREYNPVIQEDSTSNIKIWLLVGFVILACLGIIAVAILGFM